MSELERTVEALRRCIPAEQFDAAMAEIDRNAATSNPQPADPQPVDIEDIIHDLLTELGTPAHIKGHSYLATGLLLVYKDPDLIHNITEGLYADIAKIHDTTKSRAEKAVRHAIEVTWDRGDLDVLSKYFGGTIRPDKGRPTNSEFVARMYHIIGKRVKEAKTNG